MTHGAFCVLMETNSNRPWDRDPIVLGMGEVIKPCIIHSLRLGQKEPSGNLRFGDLSSNLIFSLILGVLGCLQRESLGT